MHDSYKIILSHQWYIKILLGICGLLICSIGITGLTNTKYALIIDYHNGSDIVDMSIFLVVYGFLIALSVVCKPSLAVFFTVPITVTSILSLCAVDWLVRYGHIAGLDVAYRDYDKHNVCWNGIVTMDRNAIESSNCFTTDNKFIIFCAQCRQEYYPGEPTFLRSKRFTVALTVLCLLLVQIGHVYVIYSKITTRRLQSSKQTTTTSLVETITTAENETTETYIDLKDDEYDDEFDHYDQINKNLYANGTAIVGKDQTCLHCQPVYYSVPRNNTSINQTHHTFIEPQKPSAPQLFLL
ncbi:ARIF-1 [Chrysodeixis includens nucleopolyhedrovirus]|uniref:ARIF-1 n=1 Tax=Chrysodeixis includens nucleopolyhedrovirus TaxID=1207438 RepID=A0A5B8YU34_9ABAC|nr:ARIF-1 [Chrysodeixis includens nucleopolyhedrovirus]QED40651.1 ARIF-1 [Chrysodeixis includens nucleopolyhedrovirus]